jgi:hypothetical protein
MTATTENDYGEGPDLVRAWLKKRGMSALKLEKELGDGKARQIERWLNRRNPLPTPLLGKLSVRVQILPQKLATGSLQRQTVTDLRTVPRQMGEMEEAG